MPDIKSALQAALLRAPNPVVKKTIDEWDDEGEGFPINISSVSVQTSSNQTNPMPTTQPVSRPSNFGITNNVMRETFNFIKNNPGLRNIDIAAGLDAKGFKRSSTTSVPSQLARAGMVERRGKLYYALVNEYHPIKSTPSNKISKLKKKVAELKKVAKGKGIVDLPVKNGGIASLTPMPAPAPAPRPVVNEFDPKAILDPLTVYQARALYNELETMFGGGYGRSA